MESLRELLGSVRGAFYQLKDNIIGWFQSLRGGDPEISDDNEIPPMEDHAPAVAGPASRTRSTSTLVPEYDRATVKSESKNFALKHFGLYPENNSNSQNLNEESEGTETSEELLSEQPSSGQEIPIGNEISEKTEPSEDNLSQYSSGQRTADEESNEKVSSF